jgi:hypothetical protein
MLRLGIPAERNVPTYFFYGLDQYTCPTILLTPTDATGALR